MVLVGAVPPLMLKTDANPGGLPIEIFDGIRKGTFDDRSQFYRDLATPFYGYNREGAKVSQGVIESFWLQGMMGGLKGQLDCIHEFSEVDYTAGLKRIDVPTAPPKGFGSLTVGAIADYLQPQIPEGAILIGHSFGGLLTQMLLDRGAGSAGIAVNPVPIGGIVPGPTSVSAIVPIVARWNGWNRPYAFTRDRWFRRFANGAPRAQSDAAYDRFVIPAPGRIFYQAASGIGTRIGPLRRTQPLLITGSSGDRLVPPYISRGEYRIQKRSGARTDYADFSRAFALPAQ